ncbi:hypothetical protein Rhe02_97050 [Rhizocola hellebori]|uniref:Uncharacterized protein n=1 Tax=Rhizocola hellebori TaxID=1392758 RepID=A0A8J3VMZ8_9ACTN|nr:hypothetical protein [Rhizocola hellebori]GIH11638.1 hypothetical protein Rhe02_97050 [Rhizocola hellebori]
MLAISFFSSTIAMASGAGCGVYDLAALAIDDPGAAGSILWHGIADPITNDWSNGNYGSASGRAGTEALMAVIGPKGLNRLGVVGKATSVWGS